MNGSAAVSQESLGCAAVTAKPWNLTEVAQQSSCKSGGRSLGQDEASDDSEVPSPSVCELKHGFQGFLQGRKRKMEKAQRS